VASQPGQPGVEPRTARCGPAIEGMIAVAGAPGSGTASARGARAARSRRLPGRPAEAAPGAAAPGLAREPELAAAASGGAGTAMGLNDLADPGGDGGAVEIGGPLPAALIELARSGSAQDKPVAGQEAAGKREPDTRPGSRRGGCRPPAAGGGRREQGRAGGFRR